ncbi:hypothetical protein S245_048522, partial [Arachis hypogaea]
KINSRSPLLPLLTRWLLTCFPNLSPLRAPLLRAVLLSPMLRLRRPVSHRWAVDALPHVCSNLEKDDTLSIENILAKALLDSPNKKEKKITTVNPLASSTWEKEANKSGNN